MSPVGARLRLTVARRGVYPSGIAADVPPLRLRRYFTQGPTAKYGHDQRMLGLLLWPLIRDRHATLGEVFGRLFGDNEAVKLALASNLGYYTDDPDTMPFIHVALPQASYLTGGGHYIRGGSQVLKGGSKSKPIKLVDGDHEISCKMDGMAIGLKACFVKKA